MKVHGQCKTKILAHYQILARGATSLYICFRLSAMRLMKLLCTLGIKRMSAVHVKVLLQ
jgi:hypothetical protein